MIRVPQLETSTQFEEGSSKLARVDLQFQSHQEHVQPLPPFLIPKLDMTKKPRIPSHPPRTPQPTPIRKPPSNVPTKAALDPLDDSRYLSAPVDILRDSVKAPRLFSSHDIAEAYCTLSTRAHRGMATSKDVSQVNRIFAALEYVKAQASIVCAAMQRDIRLAFVDPFLEVQSRNCSSLATGAHPPSNTPTGASFVERKLTLHEEKRGRDRSLVCTRAVQFISVVFHAQPFQRIFSSEQLLMLLQDILKITFAPKLPSLSASKIRLLCLWTLQSQDLPQEVLAPKAPEILKSLMKCLEKSPDTNFQAECLKVTAKLLNQQPGVFVPPFKEFLPLILQHLICDNSPRVRNLATQVLCSLAHGTINGNIPTAVRRSQSKEIVAFVNANTTRTPRSLNAPDVKLGSLAQRIHDALDNVEFETNQSSNTPSWALVVMSSLIVLSDASFFLHSRCLKLVIPVLSKIGAWKRGKGVQELHPVVWKCIVWAFARLREAERLAKTGRSQSLEKAVDMNSVFSFTRQDLRSDIGVAIIAALLWTPDHGNSTIENAKRNANRAWKERVVENSEDVGNALGIVKDMLTNPDRQVRELGRKALVRMLSGIGASTSAGDSETSEAPADGWCNAFLAPQLFDNSILSSSQTNLLTRASQIAGVDVGIVSQLSENDVSHHWDELLGIWVGLVSRLVPERKMHLPADFTQMWQALLLSQTQLTQGLGHLTTSPSLVMKVADVLINFLPPANLPPSNPSPVKSSLGMSASASSPVKRTQAGPAVGFMLVMKLWGVVRNVLASSCLSSMAERILDAVLAKEYPLSEDERLRDAWSRLCSDLVVTCFAHAVSLVLRPPSSSDSGDDSKLATVETNTRREIWRVIARSWQTAATSVSWETGVQLLMFSQQELGITSRDVELWDTLLSSVFKSAEAHGVTRLEVLNRVANEMRGELTPSAVVGLLIYAVISYVEVSETGPFSPGPFMLANEWLVKVYPAEESMESTRKEVVQKLFLLLERTVAASPTNRCSSVVLLMNEALCLWIKDEREALSGAEYNETIMSCYESILDVLHKSPPDLPTLHLLAPFLASAFVRIPPPARGPIAFKKFWDDTYKGSNASFAAGDAQRYPSEIRGCLKAFHEAFGGDPPTGITFGSSQTTTPSTTRIGPSSPFFRGEISPLFKERITEALQSSSPTTPTPPTRIRRGKARFQRDVRESSAGPSSSSTPTPPSSPTSRNTRAAGEEKVSFEFGPCATPIAITP
ncbi:hypothetical protein BJ322DRAFT_160279 [Thelephora terrestris]|uniref:Telomere-associated protein Rif1 N-terminal domain-containing protein n=1 Tax=Thelephora terrestris TaxID=56493 RepID=A0A9P6HDS5_9AGAM|nr:hypothetical protein BJ322DRAFT_160279 [Thelephora terrestris]